MMLHHANPLAVLETSEEISFPESPYLRKKLRAAITALSEREQILVIATTAVKTPNSHYFFKNFLPTFNKTTQLRVRAAILMMAPAEVATWRRRMTLDGSESVRWVNLTNLASNVDLGSLANEETPVEDALLLAGSELKAGMPQRITELLKLSPSVEKFRDKLASDWFLRCVDSFISSLSEETLQNAVESGTPEFVSLFKALWEHPVPLESALRSVFQRFPTPLVLRLFDKLKIDSAVAFSIMPSHLMGDVLDIYRNPAKNKNFEDYQWFSDFLTTAAMAYGMDERIRQISSNRHRILAELLFLEKMVRPREIDSLHELYLVVSEQLKTVAKCMFSAGFSSQEIEKFLNENVKLKDVNNSFVVQAGAVFLSHRCVTYLHDRCITDLRDAKGEGEGSVKALQLLPYFHRSSDVTKLRNVIQDIMRQGLKDPIYNKYTIESLLQVPWTRQMLDGEPIVLYVRALAAEMQSKFASKPMLQILLHSPIIGQAITNAMITSVMDPRYQDGQSTQGMDILLAGAAVAAYMQSDQETFRQVIKASHWIHKDTFIELMYQASVAENGNYAKPQVNQEAFYREMRDAMGAEKDNARSIDF